MPIAYKNWNLYPNDRSTESWKKVGLNGLFRRENSKEKCNLEFKHRFVSLFYTSQTFDILLIPYKILTLIVRKLFEKAKLKFN